MFLLIDAFDVLGDDAAAECGGILNGLGIDVACGLRLRPDARACVRFKPGIFGTASAVGKGVGNIAVNGCGGNGKFIGGMYGRRCDDSMVFDKMSR